MARGDRRQPRSWRERERVRHQERTPAHAAGTAPPEPEPEPVPEHPPGSPDVMAMFEKALAESRGKVERAVQMSTPSQPPAQPAQQPSRVSSILHALHRDVKSVGNAIDHAWPLISRLASSPALVRLVEAALKAEDINVNPDVLESAAVILEQAAAKLEGIAAAGTVQPAFQPAETGPSAIQGGGYAVTAVDGLGGIGGLSARPAPSEGSIQAPAPEAEAEPPA